MTQVVEVVSSDTTVLGRSVPRPRSVPRVLQPAAPAAAVVPPLEVHPLPLRTDARRRPVWQLVATDTGLAVLAGAATWLGGLLPLPAAAAVALAWSPVLALSGRYRHQALGQPRSARAAVLLGATARLALLVLVLAPWLGAPRLSSLTILVATLAAASAVPLLTLRAQRPRVVLAGRPRDVRAQLDELARTGTHEVVAACLTRPSREPLGGVATYVGLDASDTVARRHGADAFVVLPGAPLEPAALRRLHWALATAGTELFLGTGLLDVEPQRTRVVSRAGLDVLHVTSPALHGPRRLLKDVVERALALAVLTLALPLLAVLCVAIRRETPGPALFRQERVGRDGVPFTMLKLRSMGVDAEGVREGLDEANEKDGVLFKIARDPRVTPLGRVLRTYSLDELPQLWNVVRGDMSLVGPRPALPGEVARYDHDPRRRLVVKPGVTGLWQVSGRSDLSWEESVRLDLKYVDNWSLRQDLTILVRTVRAVLGHHGAY